MDILLIIIFSIFFLILFPLGELLRFDLANNIAITGIDVGVTILVVMGVCNFFIKRKHIKITLVKPIALFLGICFISLLWNISSLKQNEFFVSLLYSLRLGMYISLFFVVQTVSPDLKKKIPLLMIAAGFFIILGGYIQFFFYPSLRNLYYLGWDVHLYRMFSSFLDPNFLGAFLVIYLLFIIQHFIISKDKKIKIVILLLIPCSVVAVFLTYSRSAYLMLGIGIITFFLFKKLSKKIITGGVIVLLVCLTIVFSITKYSEGTNLFRTTSSNARFASSQLAFLIFQKKPLFGVGFNAYRYAVKRYKFVAVSKNMVSIDHGGAGTDNSFLFILATTGIVGFIAYVYVWLQIFISRKSVFLFASSIALFVDSFFINSLFYPLIMIWMWIVIALDY